MSQPTILVVDDEQLVVDILAEVLQEAGYTVIKACDGADGLRLAREHRPSLVITDVMMPQMTGVELVRRLKADESTASTPTILMSCVHRESVTADANCFVDKPFDLDVLLDLVRNYAPVVAADSAPAA